MKLSTVSDWLDWIAKQHTKEIELGLDRVKVVAARIGVLAFDCPVIIVGGTNGKGSTVAGLEAIYRASEYRTGAFTSPIIFKHNEMVRIHGESVDDHAFCTAYEKIAASLGDVTLTPFEWHTLAALLIFKSYPLDVVILEVGLGGRLDAVNIMDADLAIITSIGIDHVDYLGDTREKIGFEKAGIFRADQLAICGDAHPPLSLLEHAAKLGTKLYCVGKDFYDDHLPKSQIAKENLQSILMAINLLQDKLPVTQDIIHQALAEVKIIGRIQIMPGDIEKIFDVSHNPDSVLKLANHLKENKMKGKNIAVFSMLSDKDIVTSISNIKDQIDDWYVAPLNVKRAADLDLLKNCFDALHINNINYFSDLKNAYDATNNAAKTGDRIIIFGSFHVIGKLDQGLLNT